MSEPGDGEKPDKDAQASVWSRSGEGPHQLVPPSSDTNNVETVNPDPQACVPTPIPTQSPAPPAAATAEVVTPTEPADAEDLEDTDETEGDEDADGAANSDDSGDSEHDEESESETEQLQKPKGDGSPTQNDVAIGYIIVLGLYFLGYLVNMFVCNYSLVSDKMNALAEMVFYFIPALCAAAMLMGGKTFKIVGALLFLPLAGAAFYGSQYFHCFERFDNNTGPYGPAVAIKDENGWHICHYESSWTTGNMPGTTWMREKDAGPGIRYARKMRLGEPP